MHVWLGLGWSLLQVQWLLTHLNLYLAVLYAPIVTCLLFFRTRWCLMKHTGHVNKYSENSEGNLHFMRENWQSNYWFWLSISCQFLDTVDVAVAIVFLWYSVKVFSNNFLCTALYWLPNWFCYRIRTVSCHFWYQLTLFCSTDGGEVTQDQDVILLLTYNAYYVAR